MSGLIANGPLDRRVGRHWRIDMQILDNYVPTPGDLLTLGEKRLAVHWVKDGECGYAVDFGRGQFEALHRRSVAEFVTCCRDQGLAIVTPNAELRGRPLADGPA